MVMMNMLTISMLTNKIYFARKYLACRERFDRLDPILNILKNLAKGPEDCLIDFLTDFLTDFLFFLS